LRGPNIYLTGNGWIYEVWFQGRVIVIGCCATLEAAMREAANVSPWLPPVSVEPGGDV
jgi:hypothetical protein